MAESEWNSTLCNVNGRFYVKAANFAELQPDLLTGNMAPLRFYRSPIEPLNGSESCMGIK